MLTETQKNRCIICLSSSNHQLINIHAGCAAKIHSDCIKNYIASHTTKNNIKITCPSCRLELNTSNCPSYQKYFCEGDIYRNKCKIMASLIIISTIILIIFQSIVSSKFDSRVHKYSSIAILVFNFLHIIIFIVHDNLIKKFSSNAFLTKDTYNIYKNKYRRLIPLLATIVLNIIPTIYFVANSPRTSLESFMYNGIQLSFPVGWYVYLLFAYKNTKKIRYYALWSLVLYQTLICLQIFQIYWMYNSEVHYNIWLKTFSIIFLVLSIMITLPIVIFIEFIRSGENGKNNLTLDESEYMGNYTKHSLFVLIMVIYIISTLIKDPENDIDKSFGVLLPYLPSLILILEYCFVSFNKEFKGFYQDDRRRNRRYGYSFNNTFTQEFGIFLSGVIFANYVVALSFYIFGPMYCYAEIDPDFRKNESCINNCINIIKQYKSYSLDDCTYNECAPCGSFTFIFIFIYVFVGSWTNYIPIYIFQTDNFLSCLLTTDRYCYDGMDDNVGMIYLEIILKNLSLL